MGRSEFPKGSPQYISKLNKVRILNLIREHGQLSRADAAKLSGISAPTVTRIVDSLINGQLICESGAGVSSGGRRPTMLEFNGSHNFVIGIDLGTTHTYGVLTDLNAKIIAEHRIETRISEGFNAIMHRTADIICELSSHKKVADKQILGIGMAVAGLVNRIKNIVEFSPDFHWSNADIVNILEKRCNIPIIFDNVTRVMAWGELWYGIGERIKNFIVVNIGYGIGAGIIVDGKPLYGPKGMAGEFGHITLDRESMIQCDCGNYGCLEALASGHAIAKNAERELRDGATSSLQKYVRNSSDELTAEMVSIAAKEGDELALRVFKTAAEYIGIGISGLINLFTPEAIVVGGGVAKSGELLFDTIREVVNQRAMKTVTRDLIITPATYGTNAAAMGAVALILNELLHLNHKMPLPEAAPVMVG